MSAVMARIKARPAVFVASVAALVSLAIGFGLPVTPVQFGLIMAGVSTVVGFVIQSQVVPLVKVTPHVDPAPVVPPAVPPAG